MYNDNANVEKVTVQCMGPGVARERILWGEEQQ